jgi:hypothetical protein
METNMLNFNGIENPLWPRSDNQRDPAVLPVAGGYRIFYSRYSNAHGQEGNPWGKEENWAVASVFTRDFKTFTGDRDITSKGFASPGDPTLWHGRLLLPFQSYPTPPARLCFSVGTADGASWGEPRFFLDEARYLRWNKNARLIDPCWVVDGDTLHCYFVGSQGEPRANLLGHASTTDPDLQDWTIHSVEAPLMGISPEALDGVENITVIRKGEIWLMIFSEGLNNQHLAYATSKDLFSWNRVGIIPIPKQNWLSRCYGAPFVWQEEKQYLMLLMGEDLPAHFARIGLLYSEDCLNWKILPEK